MALISESLSAPRLPGEATSRQALLQRMRDKMAGLSEPELKRNAQQQLKRGANFRSRGARIALLVLAAALSWAGIEREKLTALVGPKAVPVIATPARELTVDRQLLYWTYALYDWDRFQEEFKSSSRALLNTGMARERIRALLPQAGRQAAFQVRRYQQNTGRMR